MSSSRAFTRVLVGAALVAVLAATVHAQASPEPGPGPAHPTEVDRPAGAVRTDDDTQMSPQTAAAVDRAVRSRANRRAAEQLPGTVTIPVRAHIILGTHRRDRHVTVAGIQRQIDVLNAAYAGQEAVGVVPDANSASTTADTSFRFSLRGVTRTRNDTWFHLSQPGRTANEMKKALHQGHAYTLNIYFVQPERSTGLLGYATFPYQDRAHPRLDGLVVNIQSLPGGSLTHFNQGDTAVHEIGHWLGLRHVFDDHALGSISDPDPTDDCIDNDGLADTPIQAYPTSGDPVGQDTCTGDAFPGLDSIHNFMDYGWDEAMYQFTPDQSTAMDLNWARYRAPSAAP